ncbi:MAG TPA: TonB family protein [Candidatus Acidoferrales bacterium]|nr:TonB family protein [Candidatus Acidoferrales bacterium]
MSDTRVQWLGQVVDGKFELREFVGSSPRSWVYLTEREGQRAAIKLISANARQTDARISSLEQTKSFSHPNLLRVYEVGRCRLGDTPLVYAVTEYAEENLADILAQRALTPAEVAEMLPPVLDALAYLHGKGRVHGHIKPANILATGDRVKISIDAVSAMGEMPVQPSAYDAPEIAKGGFSTQGDIWSLGMTLVEALTQKLPVILQNASDDPALPDSLPQPFLDIARECLRRQPRRRATIADVSARLRTPASVLQKPVGAPEPVARAASPAAPTAPAKAQKAPTNWRSAAPAAVLVALALVVILVAPKLLNRLQGQSAGAAAVEPSSSPATEQSAGATASVEASATKRSAAAPTSTVPSPQPAEAAPAAEKSEAVRASTTKNATESGEDNAVANPAPAPPPQPAPPAAVPTRLATSGEVVEQVLPDVPQKALDTIQGTVKVGVRVQVDVSGNVTDASLDSPGPSKYFANLAMNAARKWKFSPVADGSSTREWVLRFQFRQDGPKATSSTAAPSR